MNKKPFSITASKTLNKPDHAGGCFALNAAAGLTVTLPDATGDGSEFLFFVETSVTSNNYIIAVANSSDIMQGGVNVATDASGETHSTASTSDTVTMNGSTKGGLKGTWLRFKDIANNIWMVEGYLVASGVEATPFSAAV